MTWAPAITVVATMLATVTAAIVALPRLPRSADAPEYAALATPGFLTVVALVAGGAASLVTWSAPVTAWPPWLAYTTVGTLAAAIDARTTWLPRALTQAGWILIALGVAAMALLTSSWQPILLAGIGAVAMGGFFHLVWRVSGQLGYGDVRLMVMVGAVAGLQGVEFSGTTLFLGTLAGAVWAIVHRIASRGSSPFPYGPALFSGPYLALILGHVASAG